VSTGDMLLSVELNNISGMDIKAAFATLLFDSVTLGQSSDNSIPIVGVSSNSNTNGEFVDLSFLSGDHQFFLEKSIDNVDSFLNSYDALLALKISTLPDEVKSLDGSALNPMQFVAADFTQNGVVTAADVTAILKEIVEIDDNYNPEWKFIDSSSNYDSLARNNTQVVSAPEVLLNGVDNVGFSGVIIGDVDGSWAPDIL
jgi:hypothetical protein